MTSRRRFTTSLSVWPLAASLGAHAQAGGNLVRNPGFEDDGPGPARDWSRDQAKTGDKGQAERDTTQARSGRASLRLSPNARNEGPDPLAVSQELPLGPLRGRPLDLRASMRTAGDARATMGLVVVSRRGATLLQLNQTVSLDDWHTESRVLDLPADSNARYFLALWVDGRGGHAWFDDVWVGPAGSAPREAPAAQTTPAVAADPSTPLAARISVDAARTIRRVSRQLFGTNIEWRWHGTSLWREQRDALDEDVVRLARDMGVTVIRYPGGIFSDFFDWRDSIGPRAKRPLRQHEPDKPDRTRPLFGTDEALDFAQRIGGELLLTANFANGTPELAADWVRYVNARSLRVRFWEVGNEIYIRDGSGVSKAVSVEPEVYARRYLEFARAMRRADPRIRIGAVGGENFGRYRLVAYPEWNRRVFEIARDEIDFLSVHNAYAPVIYDEDDRDKDLRTIYRAMMAAPVLIARNLQTLEQQLQRWGSPERRPFVAVTEWGPIFQWVHRGRYVDHNKTLGSALFCASVMKALLESPGTGMANFFMLNDFGVTGWISSMNDRWPPPDPEWALTARALAFKIFTRHFGDVVVASLAQGPTFDSEDVGLTAAVRGAPWLETVAALSDDGSELHLVAINRHFDAPMDAAIEIQGFRPAARGDATTLSGTGIDAHLGSKVINVPALGWARQIEDPVHRRFAHGGPGEVTLQTRPIDGLGSRFALRLPARSVTSIRMVRA